MSENVELSDATAVRDNDPADNCQPGQQQNSRLVSKQEAQLSQRDRAAPYKLWLNISAKSVHLTVLYVKSKFHWDQFLVTSS